MNINMQTSTLATGKTYNFSATNNAASNAASKTEKEETEKTAKAKPAAPAPKNEDESLLVNEDGDTAQISNEGKVKSAEGTTATYEEKDASQIVSAQVAEAEESEDSTDLSSYSEQELQEMVDSGEITQAQMSSELARRAAEEESSDNTAASSSDAEFLESMTNQSEILNGLD